MDGQPFDKLRVDGIGQIIERLWGKGKEVTVELRLSAK